MLFRSPYDGVTATNFDACDFTATALVAGPNALYRAYVSGANKALVKKTTLVTQPIAATVTLTFHAVQASNQPLGGCVAGRQCSDITWG